MGGGPTEILPPKKQAVVDRLRRRIDSYRRHQKDCVPRFDHSFNGVVEQNVQDTLLLKQRFLENKAKRTVKKSDKKTSESSVQNASASLQKYGTKRSASEDVESNGSDNYIGSSTCAAAVDGPPSKSSPAPANNKDGLTKFSVEIVQQLEFTTSTSNSQISANVTVKAMNTCIKSDPANSPPSSPSVQQNPQQIIECKREPEMKFVDLEECAAALEKDAAALHGDSSFPGFTDLIGDDTSDAFNDLISDISDFNTEFMRDFDFDNSSADSKTTVSNSLQNSNQLARSPVNESVHHIKTEANEMPHLHPSCSQSRINYHPGLDMSKAELSPAAQTLKQMAEQHQVKAAALGVGYGSRLQGFGNVPPQSVGNSPLSLSNTSPFSQELKQEVYPNPGQNQGQNNQSNNQGSPGPQTKGHGRSGPPGGPRFKATFGNFSGRQNQQRNQSGASSLHAAQTQQLHSQGHQIQVSLAQSMSAELKGGVMSLGAQQASFMTSSGQDSYCTVSQSQNLSFSQSNLRPRAARHAHHRAHLPVVLESMNPNAHLGPRQEFRNKSLGVQHPLSRFSQPRMLSLQPMPPSGPLLRNPYMNPGTVRVGLHGPSGKTVRDLASHNDNLSWKPMLLHQPRTSTHFHQNHGGAFSTNDNQLAAGQVQHVNIAQHPSLGLHQVNPSMSVRIQMNQNMSTNPVYTSGGKPAHSASSQDHPGTPQQDGYPPTSSYSSNPAAVYTNSYSQHPPTASQQTLQTHQSQTGSMPAEFNLDFLEHLPTDSTGHFTDQDLINSLESTASFNFHDIL